MAAVSIASHSSNPPPSLPQLRAYTHLQLIYITDHFEAVAAMVGGTAIGTLYRCAQDSSTWFGKVGNDLNFEQDDPNSWRSRTKKGMNGDAIREKVGSDFYAVWGRGAFLVPETGLSEQPMLDPYSREHFLAQHWHGQGITDCLRVMARFVDGYKNFSEAQTLDGGAPTSLLDFIKTHHRPPMSLITDDGREVPLRGFVEMCAVGRALADTDMFGGTGKNAGFKWITDETGTIVAAQTVKIDPGCVFECAVQRENTPSMNTVYNMLHRLGCSRYWFSDFRDIQIANQNTSVTLRWDSLLAEQQELFQNTLTHCLTFLEGEAMSYLVKREGSFDRGPLEKIPESYADYLITNLTNWLRAQQRIYWQQVGERVLPLELGTPSPHFVGRTTFLEGLENHLVGSLNERPLCTLVGEGGFGKSQLALAFASAHRQDFSLIYWIHAETPEMLELSYRSLGNQLGVVAPDDNLDRLQTKVHNFLETEDLGERWLLIYDNVERTIPLPARGNGAILITTREPDLWEGEPSFQLSPFEFSEVRQLFALFHVETRAQEIRTLMGAISPTPLLMTHAARYLQNHRRSRVESYLAELETLATAASGVNRELLPLVATLQTLRAYPQALQFAEVCSFLNPDAIPTSYLTEWLRIKREENPQEKTREILYRLTHHGVIT
ncbi:MAG: hypothetical protein KAR79_01785, partial [Simkaniaceae bacterium]|nr:hypothetical protein [Simkaniaceae bacterium]